MHFVAGTFNVPATNCITIVLKFLTLISISRFSLSLLFCKTHIYSWYSLKAKEIMVWISDLIFNKHRFLFRFFSVTTMVMHFVAGTFNVPATNCITIVLKFLSLISISRFSLSLLFCQTHIYSWYSLKAKEIMVWISDLIFNKRRFLFRFFSVTTVVMHFVAGTFNVPATNCITIVLKFLTLMSILRFSSSLLFCQTHIYSWYSLKAKEIMVWISDLIFNKHRFLFRFFSVTTMVMHFVAGTFNVPATNCITIVLKFLSLISISRFSLSLLFCQTHIYSWYSLKAKEIMVWISDLIFNKRRFLFRFFSVTTVVMHFVAGTFNVPATNCITIVLKFLTLMSILRFSSSLLFCQTHIYSWYSLKAKEIMVWISDLIFNKHRFLFSFFLSHNSGDAVCSWYI